MFQQIQQCKADQCSKEEEYKGQSGRYDDTSTQSSPIKTRRASLETAAKLSTSDDIKRCFFCGHKGRKIKMITVKSGLAGSDTTVR